MEFDAEIDAELSALSDFSVEDEESIESADDVDVEENVPQVDYDPSHVDWMKLFLDRTGEQTKNIETSLNDAETVLKEIDKNVNESHSRPSSVLQERECEAQETTSTKENFIKQLVDNEDKEDLNEEVSILDPFLDVQKLQTDKRILEFETLCEEEILYRINDIEAKRLASEKHLQELEAAERKILFELHQQKFFYENERKHKAACLIQALYRRYAVRKIYGVAVDDRLQLLKERRTQERLQLIEERRKQEAIVAQQHNENAVFQTEVEEELDEKDRMNSTDSENFSVNRVAKVEGSDQVEKLTTEGFTADVCEDQTPVYIRTKRVEDSCSSSENTDFKSDSEESTPVGVIQVTVSNSLSNHPQLTIPNNPKISCDKNSNVNNQQASEKELKTPVDSMLLDGSDHQMVQNLEENDSTSFNENSSASLHQAIGSLIPRFNKEVESTEKFCQERKPTLPGNPQPIAGTESFKIKPVSPINQNLSSASEQVLSQINPSNASHLDLDKKANFCLETSTMKNLQRDLTFLEQSVVLVEDQGKTSTNLASAPQQNLASSPETSKQTKNLLQAINDDLSQLNASVVLESHKERKNVETPEIPVGGTLEIPLNNLKHTCDSSNFESSSIFSKSNDESEQFSQVLDIIETTTSCGVCITSTASDGNRLHHQLTDPGTSKPGIERFELVTETSGPGNETSVSGTETIGPRAKTSGFCAETFGPGTETFGFGTETCGLGIETFASTSSLPENNSSLAHVSPSNNTRLYGLEKAGTDVLELATPKNSPRFSTEKQSVCNQVENGLVLLEEPQNSIEHFEFRKQTRDFEPASHSPESFSAKMDNTDRQTKDKTLNSTDVETEKVVEEEHHFSCSETFRTNSPIDKPVTKSKDDVISEIIPTLDDVDSVLTDKLKTSVGKTKAVDLEAENIGISKPKEYSSQNNNQFHSVSISKATTRKAESKDFDEILDSNHETDKRVTVSQENTQSVIQVNEKEKIRHDTLKVPSSTLWKSWQKQCLAWELAKAKSAAKPHLKRAMRKSSAAKRLPPLSEEDILKGKWPYCKPLTNDRTLETLSRIYVTNADNSCGHNLINIQRCVNLTHLTLFQCGLVSLEGLLACPSLRHINVSHNNISVISCDGMKRLESLVARNNRLTSIHGLSGCHSLLLLDLSHNSITKIAGLEETQSMAHLLLADNQLLSITGLRALNSLLSLDVSANNLSNLDGIENCGLLRCLNASNNSFSKIPAENLTNLILLVELNLNKNRIENLDVTLDNENCVLFLPLLAYLWLQCNKISFEDGLGACPISKCAPLLWEINLSQNFMSNPELMLSFLYPLSCLKRFVLYENLFSSQQEEHILVKCQERDFEVIFCNDVILTSPSKTVSAINELLTLPPLPNLRNTSSKASNDFYLNVAEKQRKEYFELIQTETKELKDLTGWKMASNSVSPCSTPPDLFAYHCDYLQKHSELSIHQRLIQEGRHAHVEKSIPSVSESKDARIEQPHTSVAETLTETKNPDLRQSKLASNQKIEDLKFSRKSRSLSIQPTAASNSTIKVEKPSSVDQSINCAAFYKDQKNAAIKIQMCWKRYAKLKRRRLEACICIQAAWRGYVVRRNFRKAFASFNTSNSVDIEDFEEVDLSQLEFDENIYDQQWAIRTNIRPPNLPPPSTPTHRSHSAGVVRPSLNSPSKATSLVMDDSAAQKLHSEIDNTQNVWQKIASLSKPPLPPITPTGSTLTTDHYYIRSLGDGTRSDIDSHRSKFSRKEEVLADEWGLHNSSAVELMLKRAKRMKGRKKKHVNADEKLRRFQDIKQKVNEKPLATTRKNTQPQHRMEYFKARELEFEPGERKPPSEDDEQRRQYTFEWLHASANMSASNIHHSSHRGHYSTPRNHARWHQSDSESAKSSFLPIIPQQRSVVSPLQQNELEIASVSSHNTQRTRNKNLLRDIARRHAGL